MKFENRVMLKVYLEKGELEELQAAAEKCGKSGSEYVRGLLGKGEVRDEVVLDAAHGKADRISDTPRDTEVSAPRRRKSHSGGLDLPVVGEGDRVAKEGQKACAHGKAKGYHCWQCGGLANVQS